MLARLWRVRASLQKAFTPITLLIRSYQIQNKTNRFRPFLDVLCIFLQFVFSHRITFVAGELDS